MDSGLLIAVAFYGSCFWMSLQQKGIEQNCQDLLLVYVSLSTRKGKKNMAESKEFYRDCLGFLVSNSSANPSPISFLSVEDFRINALHINIWPVCTIFLFPLDMMSLLHYLQCPLKTRSFFVCFRPLKGKYRVPYKNNQGISPALWKHYTSKVKTHLE